MVNLCPILLTGSLVFPLVIGALPATRNAAADQHQLSTQQPPLPGPLRDEDPQARSRARFMDILRNAKPAPMATRGRHLPPHASLCPKQRGVVGYDPATGKMTVTPGAALPQGDDGCDPSQVRSPTSSPSKENAGPSDTQRMPGQMPCLTPEQQSEGNDAALEPNGPAAMPSPTVNTIK